MYIDNTIPLPENVPAYLQKDFDHLEKLYHSKAQNHDLYFDMYFEGVEPNIKTAYLNGQITKAEAMQIFAHYGITD